MRRLHHTLVPLLLTLSLLAGPAMAGERTPLRPLEPRIPAPDFTLQDMDDETHRLSDYRGRVVLVNFWATWCPPCRREMPSMQRAWEQLRPEGIEILAVDVGEDEETIFTFSGELELEFPILLDHDATAVEKWPVRGLPATFVVDPEGRIAYQVVGGREWDDPAIMEQLRQLRIERPAGIRARLGQ